MSVSGFYHHFKAVTAMSPWQLQEARRLMLGEGLDATTLPYRRCVAWTGYEESQGKMSACG